MPGHKPRQHRDTEVIKGKGFYCVFEGIFKQFVPFVVVDVKYVTEREHKQHDLQVLFTKTGQV